MEEILGLFFLALYLAAVVMAVIALTSVGVVYGAGTALRNYALALANNVKPQRVTT